MRAWWVLVVMGALIAGGVAPYAVRPVSATPPSTLNRPEDPVVLTGADVPSMTGIAPGMLVAFRYAGGWQQIPVQVDERAVKDFGTIYHLPMEGVTSLVYTDAGTFTGADPDATLDSNDEIVFMAKDAGGVAPSGSGPAGVSGLFGVELTISDPLDPAQTGYVYLFRQDGSLNPGAGQQYVTYAFNLLSGPYLTMYNTTDGPNAENSTITTPYYAHHFSDRWADDELHITAGAATGVDILDRHKALFAPGNCGRSEDTFDNGDSSGFPGEGAFVVNKSGPVRAIRSYVGANSGPRTQREHIFYAQRQDLRTFLRVHEIGSILDFFDYSPAAAGMTYYNDLNPSGVTIDGVPDSPAAGATQWEMVNGAQGALFMAHSAATDISPFSWTSYHLDDVTPAPVTQCTGDAFAYGSSGLYITNTIPCTDPAVCPGAAKFLNTTRTMYYEAPGLTAAGAAALNSIARTPLSVAAQLFTIATDTDGDNCPDSVEIANQGTKKPDNPTDRNDFPDADHSGKVEVGDFSLMLRAWNATPTSANWDARVDFDQSGKVAVGDFSLLLKGWNRSCS